MEGKEKQSIDSLTESMKTLEVKSQPSQVDSDSQSPASSSQTIAPLSLSDQETTDINQTATTVQENEEHDNEKYISFLDNS